MATFKMNCPWCEQKVEVEEEWLGTIVNCPACQKEFIIKKDDSAAMPQLKIVNNDRDNSAKSSQKLKVAWNKKTGIISGIVFVCGLLAILLSGQKEAIYKKGEKLYNEKNYVEAVKYLREAAEKGHAKAQLALGECYYLGRGVSQDYAEMVKWYRKAAEQGNADAQCSLAICYQNGHGVSRDRAEMVKWYRKAAEQGDAMAQYKLGYFYYYGGWGVPQDYAKAVEWYRKAAAQGFELAERELKRLEY